MPSCSAGPSRHGLLHMLLHNIWQGFNSILHGHAVVSLSMAMAPGIMWMATHLSMQAATCLLTSGLPATLKRPLQMLQEGLRLEPGQVAVLANARHTLLRRINDIRNARAKIVLALGTAAVQPEAVSAGIHVQDSPVSQRACSISWMSLPCCSVCSSACVIGSCCWKSQMVPYC